MEIKNIIIINDFDYTQGGASKVAIDTANLLSDKYNVLFFSAVHKDNNELNNKIKNVSLNLKEFKDYDNKLDGLKEGICNKVVKDRLNNLLDKYSTLDTIIHIHGWTKALSSIVFKVCKDKNFTTFLTAHEYFSICPNGGLYNYKTNKQCFIKPMSFNCLICNCDSRNYIYKLYRYKREAQYYKDIDFNYINTIFVSELTEKLIKERIDIKGNNTVIYNPYKRIKNNKNKEYDFIYIGRSSKEKGTDLFIRLANELKDYRFILVGDYNDELPNNVLCTGWVNEDKVDDYLSKSRCLILPSLWPEPFGLNVYKAIKAGIPSLVSSNSAPAYILNDDLSFKQGDYIDLKLKALNLINNDFKVELNVKIKDNYIDKLVEYYEKCVK